MVMPMPKLMPVQARRGRQWPHGRGQGRERERERERSWSGCRGPIVVLRFMLNVLLPNCEQDSFMFQHIEQHAAESKTKTARMREREEEKERQGDSDAEDALAVHGGVVAMAINHHRLRCRRRRRLRLRQHCRSRRHLRRLRRVNACYTSAYLQPPPFPLTSSQNSPFSALLIIFKFAVCTPSRGLCGV